VQGYAKCNPNGLPQHTTSLVPLAHNEETSRKIDWLYKLQGNQAYHEVIGV